MLIRLAGAAALACYAIAAFSQSVSAQSAVDTEPETNVTHVEIDPIKVDLGPDGKIETMAMERRGNLLLGISWKDPAAKPQEKEPSPPKLPRDPVPETRPPAGPVPEPGRAEGQPRQRPNAGRRRRGPRTRPPWAQDDPDRKYAMLVVSPEGKVIEKRPMTIAPKMIHGCPNGDVYVVGHHEIARLDAKGKTVKTLPFKELFDGEYEKADPSGITVCEKYVFVALGNGFSLRATEDILRVDRELAEPKIIVKKQFGCCAHIDLDVKGDVLLVAENSRHRVNRFTFEGERIGTWGQRSRTAIEGFAACCNPVNVDFGPGGVLFTAESGIGRVKKYTPEGEYLGFVGYVDTTKFDRGSRLAATSCYIPIEVAADGKRIYVMDVRANFVRVLAEKE